MTPPIERLLLARHRLPEWAAFAELRAGTGYGRGSDQRFDVAAFNCYPSKRNYRVVYEVKQTRGDFLRELDQPAKRGQAEDFFHETWFAVAKGVCTVEEVPDGWGLITPTKKGDKLRQLKRARPREPEPVPYPMIMSVLRRACERVDDRGSRGRRARVRVGATARAPRRRNQTPPGPPQTRRAPDTSAAASYGSEVD